MAPEEIVTVLKEAFGDRIAGAEFQTAHPRVEVKPEAWPDVAAFLRNDKRMGFNFLRCISAVDMLEDDEFIAVVAAAPDDRPCSRVARKAAYSLGGRRVERRRLARARGLRHDGNHL